MNIEGMTYLSTPEITYLLKYIFYTFQYYTSVFFIIGIIVFSIVVGKKIPYNKFSLISFILFILPITIGFIYSILVRPVMPYRALIYSFPFFVILIFSFSTQLKKIAIFICCTLIITVNIYTLVQKRNHYQIFNQGIVSAAVQQTKTILTEGINPYVIVNTPEFNINFYQKKN
jgi:hypothetical protein